MLQTSVNRRQWLRSSALLVGGAALGGLPHRAATAGPADAALLQELKACTPPKGDRLAALLAGNRRFMAAWQAAAGEGSLSKRMATLAQVWNDNCQIDPQALAQGQKPWVAMLSCADSRIPPEWIFANGSGEMFQVRCAGNTAFDDGIASLEYAVSVLGISLVLVMGHSGCGAVKAAMGSQPLTPLLEGLVKPIRASLVAGDDLTQAIQANARYAAAQLTGRSSVLKDAVAAGTLQIHSAYFDIASGRVTML